MESYLLDEIDRRIVHALTAQPRASFRSLAVAVAVSDQTVMRRYQRMRDVAGLRVLGRANASRVGWSDWFLRLQCVPGSAPAVANALAARPDTSWVHLASGGTEVVCALQTRSPEQRDALLLTNLPGSRRVATIYAHSLLHIFTAPAWNVLTKALSAAELERLGPLPSLSDDGATVRLTAADEALLAHLARDGRASNASLAAATNRHESNVRRRIDQLWRTGALYFDIDLDSRALGLAGGAMMWASVEPDHLEATGQAMAAHPEIPFVAATTGPTNLVATVVCVDERHLYQYFTHRFAALPGVHAVETAPLIRTVKRAAPIS
ncbi:MAG TPA: AsnC family transcriptional regulator [Jatrophihabitantaceae bacterium]